MKLHEVYEKAAEHFADPLVSNGHFACWVIEGCEGKGMRGPALSLFKNLFDPRNGTVAWFSHTTYAERTERPDICSEWREMAMGFMAAMTRPQPKRRRKS